MVAKQDQIALKQVEKRKLVMPNVGGKKYPYTKEGRAAAAKAKAKAKGKAKPKAKAKRRSY